MSDCLFCKIAAHAIPADIVYEDDTVMAFLDIRPVNPGHTLVIPKAHFENLYNTPDDVLAALSAVTKRTAIAVKRAASADGINIWQNNEPAAGQVIFHTHLHIIPRHENDGLTLWKQGEYKDNEAVRIQESIKNSF